MQLLAILILPLAILLVAITFGSIALHQSAMRTMIGERDERAVRTAASALGEQLNFRASELTGLAVLLSSSSADTIADKLAAAAYLLPNFEGGLAVFDSNGKRSATLGDPSIWEAWTKGEAPAWNRIYSQLDAQVGKPAIIPSPIDGKPLGILSAKMDGGQLIVGAFPMSPLAQHTLAEALPTDSQLTVALLDQNRQVLYQTGQLEGSNGDHPGIAEALQGKSGTAYVQVGNDEHVTAYSPVAKTGWALITEESWEFVSTPTLRTTQIAPLVLVPALLIMVLALWFGARRVVRL